jgi:ribosome recycling factor
MSNIIDQHKPELDKAIEFLKGELNSLRTGRANVSILEKVMVEAYGSKMPIVQVGSIAVPEARSITIEPWDKSILKDLERSLREANLGLGIVNEGTLIRLTVPLMTEENRKELVKILSQRLEQSKQSVRKIRDRIRETIISEEKEKKISEDEKFKALKKLDETIGEYNDKIKKMGEEKEKEIMTV